MGTVSVSLPADGTTAEVADYNTPITTIVSEINGGLDNDNIATGAAIDGSKLADASVTPAKRSGGFKVGTFTLSATGSFAVTGVGFTGKKVRFTHLRDTSATTASTSWGGADGTSQFAVSSSFSGSTGATGSFSNRCIHVTNTSGTALIVATFTSFDADGFTMNVATYSGTYGSTFAYEVEA